MKKTFFTLASLLFASMIYSQVSTIGAETQVNTTVANSQQNPAIAVDLNDNFVIVWESLNQDGSGYGIYAQRYSSAGAVVGSEAQINTTTSNDQRFPAVAIDDAGNYTVVWQSLGQDGDGWGIYQRRFDNTGTALTGEVLVNTTTAGQQRFADIAMDDDGDYVVVWESEFDVYLQRYNNAGVAQGTESIINATTANSQNYPAVAIDSDGDFVVTWQSLNQDGDGYGVYAQTYNAAAAVQTSEFLVNTTTTNNQLSPDIAMDMDGNFNIVWVSNLQDGSQEGIYAQRFNSAGTPQGSEFLVNTTTTGAQDNPSINMTMTGDFIVTWNSYDQDGNRFGTYFKGFNLAGIVSNPETLVNTTTTNFQQFAAVGLNAKTTATIVWQDGDRNTAGSVDGDDYTIVLQRYDVVALPVELLSFTAKATDTEQVLLQWQTSSELNNKGFELERGTNGKEWKAITFIKGAGTSLETQEYEYLDQQPFKGINYYRLKQMDVDGAFEYSEIRVVKLGKFNLSIAPNPVQDVLYFTFDDIKEIQNIQLYNNAGQLVKEVSSFDGQINMQELNTGIYILVVHTAAERFEVRVVKQ
ncbi:MAG: T9SS type A sorting domain-containing protein [Bacteroidota bacterium]